MGPKLGGMLWSKDNGSPMNHHAFPNKQKQECGEIVK